MIAVYMYVSREMIKDNYNCQIQDEITFSQGRESGTLRIMEVFVHLQFFLSANSGITSF